MQPRDTNFELIFPEPQDIDAHDEFIRSVNSLRTVEDVYNFFDKYIGGVVKMDPERRRLLTMLLIRESPGEDWRNAEHEDNSGDEWWW